MKIPEFVSLLVIVVLIVNLVLMALGKISVFWFFLILGLGALMAYFGVPYLRRIGK